jgi:hypothetical protein
MLHSSDRRAREHQHKSVPVGYDLFAVTLTGPSR